MLFELYSITSALKDNSKVMYLINNIMGFCKARQCIRRTIPCGRVRYWSKFFTLTDINTLCDVIVQFLSQKVECTS